MKAVMCLTYILNVLPMAGSSLLTSFARMFVAQGCLIMGSGLYIFISLCRVHSGRASGLVWYRRNKDVVHRH